MAPLGYYPDFWTAPYRLQVVGPASSWPDKNIKIKQMHQLDPWITVIAPHQDTAIRHRATKRRLTNVKNERLKVML